MTTGANGSWRMLMLKVAGGMIILLISVLLGVIGWAFDHIVDDHRSFSERLLKLEQAASRK